MTDTEQMQAFSDDLDRLVRRYQLEFDITIGAVLAALEIKKFTLCAEAAQRHREGERGH